MLVNFELCFFDITESTEVTEPENRGGDGGTTDRREEEGTTLDEVPLQLLLRNASFSLEVGASLPKFFQKSSFSLGELKYFEEGMLALHLFLKEEEDEETLSKVMSSLFDLEELGNLKVTFFFLVVEEVTLAVGNDKAEDLAGDTTGPGVIVTMFGV